jgi:hypothetical protein
MQISGTYHDLTLGDLFSLSQSVSVARRGVVVAFLFLEARNAGLYVTLKASLGSMFISENGGRKIWI